MAVFKKGIKFYEKGAWKRAKEELSKIEKIMRLKDPPTRCLLQYMAGHNFQAPITWNGCRILNDK
jgi:hypothetical protein